MASGTVHRTLDSRPRSPAFLADERPSPFILAGAILCALSRWAEPTRYRDDGRAAIDNNAAERVIPPKRAAFAAEPRVPGRKNWLFAGSDAGGRRAAAVASLLETAKLNGIDPEAYLRHVLGTIADHPVSRVADMCSSRSFARTRRFGVLFRSCRLNLL